VGGPYVALAPTASHAASLLIFFIYNPSTFHMLPPSNGQRSPVADKPARRAASQRTCCKQIRWTLSLRNLRPSCQGFASKVANFQLPHLHLTHTPLAIGDFIGYFWTHVKQLIVSYHKVSYRNSVRICGRMAWARVLTCAQKFTISHLDGCS